MLVAGTGSPRLASNSRMSRAAEAAGARALTALPRGGDGSPDRVGPDVGVVVAHAGEVLELGVRVGGAVALDAVGGDRELLRS